MVAPEKVRDLGPRELALFNTMHGRIRARAGQNRLRSDYRDAKKRLDDKMIGFSVPPHMNHFQMVLGWNEKTCSVPAARIRADGYTSRVQSSLLDMANDIMSTDHHNKLEKHWIRSAMDHGVAFAFVSQAEDIQADPVRVIRSAREATAEMDPQTGEVIAALDMHGTVSGYLYFPGYTVEVAVVRGSWVVVSEDMLGVPNMVPCTPMVWASSTEHPFGQSRITRPLMGFTDAGVRTMLRQETHAEYFSAPQRTLMGADPMHFTNAKGERITPLDALVGGVWALPDVWDEDEQKLVRPALQQLAQASMQPHSDMLRSIASMVSSETTIPLGYLGVVHDNPSSAEAILATESDMVAMIEAEFPSIGAARVDFARKTLAMKHGEYTREMRSDLSTLRARFRNPGTPTLAARADAGQKFVTTFPDADPEVAMEIYGLDQGQIERNLAYAKKLSTTRAVDALVSGASPVTKAGAEANAVPGID